VAALALDAGHWAHAGSLARTLQRVDQTNADCANLDIQVEDRPTPFTDVLAGLDQRRGIGPVGAAVAFAETGTEMTRFTTQEPPAVVD
jgi:hypothetical protein